jgi:hypothetical protein
MYFIAMEYEVNFMCFLHFVKDYMYFSCDSLELKKVFLEPNI